MDRNTLKHLLLISLFGAGTVALFAVDPENSHLFPACPFHWATGLLCPGCGSQRALHDLLHFRVAEAFAHNPALIIALPLLGLQWALDRVRRGSFASDDRAVWGWGIALLGWGILRNLPVPGLHAP